MIFRVAPLKISVAAPLNPHVSTNYLSQSRSSQQLFSGQVEVSFGSISTELGCRHHVRSYSVSDRTADIADGLVRAKS
jgi:hypothetical protein